MGCYDMLTEIRCEKFGDDKSILFSEGLNVIQGYGGNSIGKSNMLKIIDYAFGGNYYSDSNKDVIKHIGKHEICFCHSFGDKRFYFKRAANSTKKILWCNSDYTPIKEDTIEAFCEWLVKQYQLEDRACSWRLLVGLYARIWNKPNKEVDRPLFNYKAQTIDEAIINLVKLFNEYKEIGECHQQYEYLKAREKVWSTALSYHLLDMPTQKKRYDELKAEIKNLEERAIGLRRIISAHSIEKSKELSVEKNELLEERSGLLQERGRCLRAQKRLNKNLSELHPVCQEDFVALKEFFPDVDCRRLETVQDFHNTIRTILKEEYEQETVELNRRLASIEKSIEDNEKRIQDTMGMPVEYAQAMDELESLIRKQESLKKKVELYEEKSQDTKQRDNNKAELNQKLGNITSEIAKKVNVCINALSTSIDSGNSRAPEFTMSAHSYTYGVSDNTGTGKAYTDLLLFDLAILSLTDLPMVIHDSFLFNNIDDGTIGSFVKLYARFANKQVFISLDSPLTKDDEIERLISSHTRLYLSESKMLFGKDWRVGGIG